MIAWLILLVLLSPSLVQAATRYASPSGSGTACTVLATPCSLTTVLSQAVAGDEVVLLDGTYTSVITTVNNGSAGNHIVIRAQNVWGAIVSTSGGTHGLGINRDYITVQDIDFNQNSTTQTGIGYYHTGDGTDVHDTIVEGCRFRNAKYTGLKFGIYTTIDTTQFYNHIIRNSTIENVGMGDNPGSGGEGEALYIGNNSGTLDQFRDIEIYGNTISNFTEQGVDAKDTTTRLSIHDNLFQNQVYPTDRGFTGLADGTIVLGGDNHRVYNNILYNNKAGSSAFMAQDNARHEIYNNVVYNQLTGDAARDGWWSFTPASGQTKIYNNTFWNCSAHTVTTSAADAIFTVKNNAGINGVSGNVPTTSMTSGYFVNAATGNFHLTSSATNLIDDGSGIPLAIVDFDGISASGIRDVGAFEFAEAAPPATNISAAVGQRNKPTGAAPATDALTGLAFTPKIVFFNAEENSITAPGSTPHAVMTIGVGRTTSEQRVTSWSAEDNVATTDAYRRYENFSLAAIDNTSGSMSASGSLTSLDSTGFTLSWSPNDVLGSIYNYLAIGGDSISAKITEQVLTSSTGNVNYAHGLGTTPSVVFFLYNSRPSTGPTGGAIHSFGVATANSEQWVLATRATSGTAIAADMNTESYARTSMVVAHIISTGGAILCESSLVSMDSTNVTLNQTGSWSAGNFLVMVAIAGGNWKVGSTAKAITGAPASDTIVSGLSFEPKGIILASHGKAASSSVIADAHFALGFASESNEVHVTAAAKDAVLPTQTDTRNSATRALSIVTPGTGTLTTNAELDITLGATDVTGSWNPNHATASQILWCAFGEAAPAGGIIPRLITQFKQRR